MKFVDTYDSSLLKEKNNTKHYKTNKIFTKGGNGYTIILW